jgi:hypothetical protein
LEEKLMRGPDVLNITQFVNDCVLDVLNGKIFDRLARKRKKKNPN